MICWRYSAEYSGFGLGIPDSFFNNGEAPTKLNQLQLQLQLQVTRHWQIFFGADQGVGDVARQ